MLLRFEVAYEFGKDEGVFGFVHPNDLDAPPRHALEKVLKRVLAGVL